MPRIIPEESDVTAVQVDVAIGDGITNVGIATVGADAESNTTNRLKTLSWLMSFNGTTWDRIRSGLVTVQTTFVGVLNSLGMGRYNTTPPTLSDGNIVVTQMDARGNIKTAIADGVNQVSVVTVGADGESNTTNRLNAVVWNEVFNGTTWDRVRSGVVTPTATLTGHQNVLPEAVYNATPTVRTEGQGGVLQADANGNLFVSLGSKIAGEDQSADVLKTEHQYSGTQCASDTQVKASAGFIHTLTFQCTDTAPTAGSIIVYDNTAESGTVICNFQISTTVFNPFTVVLDRVCSTGIYVGFTTTADVAVQVTWR